VLKEEAMMQSSTDLIYLASACVCAAVSAVFDIKSRRIPNFITGPCLAAGLVLHGIGDGWHGLLTSMAAALICGAIFLIFYLAGGMGAGDVKLITAVGALAGLPHVAYLLILSALAGGVMGVFLAISRGKLLQTLGNVTALLTHHRQEGLTPHPELNVGNANTLRLPYGVAIAVGCAVTCYLQGIRG
jgi:prepilin peptidase CpaA